MEEHYWDSLESIFGDDFCDVSNEFHTHFRSGLPVASLQPLTCQPGTCTPVLSPYASLPPCPPSDLLHPTTPLTRNKVNPGNGFFQEEEESVEKSQKLLAWLPSWKERTSAYQQQGNSPQAHSLGARSELVLPNWRAGGRGRQCKSLLGLTLNQAIMYADEFDRDLVSLEPMPVQGAEEDKVVSFIASRITTGEVLVDLYGSVSTHSQRRVGGGLYAATLNARGIPACGCSSSGICKTSFCFRYQLRQKLADRKNRVEKYVAANLRAPISEIASSERSGGLMQAREQPCNSKLWLEPAQQDHCGNPFGTPPDELPSRPHKKIRSVGRVAP